MRRTILLAGAALLLGTVPASAAKKLRVVATVPDLVDIARRVGGDLVEVEGIARGTEDIHLVTMRPSFVTKLNRADAVVMLGLTIEHSFLPGLLETAVNPRIRPDPVGCAGPGCIDCSVGLRVLDKPDTLSRAEGEIHPLGNPHYNMGPDNGALIAKNVAAGLASVSPEGKAVFDKNLAAYLAELEPKVAELKRLAAPLKGLKAVSVHKDTSYLEAFTGLDFVGTVELKPGIAATPPHLERLVKLMKEQGVKLIVREQHFNAKTTDWLAARTGAKVAVVSVMAGALPGTETFLKFSEHNIRALVAAAGQAP